MGDNKTISSPPLQADLFDPDASIPIQIERPRGTAGGLRPNTVRQPAGPNALHGLDEGRLVQLLEDTGRYRILRRLQPRPMVDPATLPAVPGRRLGIILDTETTGLDPARDEIIELGMLAFLFNDGGIGELVGSFSALNEPSRPIPPEITRITGITDATVAGQRIDPEAVEAFIRGADLVIAHNAGFDRPFCERLSPGFASKPWACSVREVDWSGLGFEGTKLGYLVGQGGWFHRGHRAVDDCHALLEVLAAPSRTEAPDPFRQLVAAAGRVSLHLFAEGSPFYSKDVLKARGYRWSDGSDGRPKCWWTEIGEADHDAELRFLQDEIYQAEVEPLVRRLTAVERFRR